MINKEATELLENALDEFQRLATDKFVNAATVKVRRAFALLKAEPPASKLQCPECGKGDTDVIVDIANFGGNDIYVPVHRCKCGFKWTDDVAGNVWDRNNILIKLIQGRLDASEASRKELLAACEWVFAEAEYYAPKNKEKSYYKLSQISFEKIIAAIKVNK